MSCGAASPAPVSVDALYRDHQPWLLRWLRGKLGSPLRAEDLTHDVFVRILAGRKQVDAGQARPLLRTIAHGLLVDHYRRVGLEQRSEEHTSELQSRENLVCRLLLEKKNIHTFRSADRA